MSDIQWKVAGRTIGPFTLGTGYQDSSTFRLLKRFVEEDFDTFSIDNSNHSKFGVRDGRIYWVLCGQSFIWNNTEHIGLSKKQINALHATKEEDWNDNYLSVLVDDLAVEFILVEASIRWANVTLRLDASASDDG